MIKSSVAFLQSDGGARAFARLLGEGVKRAGWVLKQIDVDAGLIMFETRGVSFMSWGGNEINVTVVNEDYGALATFNAKGKSRGEVAALPANAGPYVRSLLPYLGVPEAQ